MSKELGIRNKEEVKGGVVSFTDLGAWQEGHRLVLEIYKATEKFPKEELFGLVSQMRRSAVSITSNVAEGFSRHTYKEKIRFYAMALGSVTELQSQLYVARDIGYISAEDVQEVLDVSVTAHKIINGLIKKSKTHLPNS